MKTENCLTAFLLTFLFLLLSHIAQCQNQYFGASIGSNFTNITGDGFIADAKNRLGLAGGIYYEFEPSSRIFLQAGVWYEQKGFKDEFPTTDEYGMEIGTQDVNYNFDYLSFPIRVGRKHGDGTRFNYFVGLSPSVILSAKSILNGFTYNNVVVEDVEFELAEPFSYFNLSGFIGAAVEFKLTSNTILETSAIFHHSINKLGNKTLFNHSNLRHIGLQIGVGVKYSFEKVKD